MLKTFNKMVRFIKVIFAIMMIYIISSFLVVGYTNHNAQAFVVENYDKVAGLFYGDCTKSEAERYMKYINKLPDDLSKRIKENEWKFIVSDDIPSILSEDIPVNTVDENLHLAGITIFSKKIVYLRATEDSKPNSEVFLHELGHVVSLELSYDHGTNEFRDYYHKYKDHYPMGEYEKSTFAEFYAESFKDYMIDKKQQKINSQPLYDYFNNLLDKGGYIDLLETKDSNIRQKVHVRTSNMRNQIADRIITYIIDVFEEGKAV